VMVLQNNLTIHHLQSIGCWEPVCMCFHWSVMLFLPKPCSDSEFEGVATPLNLKKENEKLIVGLSDSPR
jgi:hypothetical protein